jgi:hypothetical protein
MSTRPPSRVPWILFQGLVLGLPAAGLVLLTTWVLRLSGVNVPWTPAIGLAVGVMTGSLSLAAFQTFDHAPPQGLDADEPPATELHDEVTTDPQPPSLLARVTTGVIIGSIFGIPMALLIFVLGLGLGLVLGDVWRIVQPAGLMAAMAYYAVLAAGIRRSLN